MDELDLHLHPRWQRTIIRELTPHFPRIQFIATTHSPLMVQAAATENLVVLRQNGDEVEINKEPPVVAGWRVDQILTSDFFDVPSRRSVHEEGLIKERDALLDKITRTQDEEDHLKWLEEQIIQLPTTENPQDRDAVDLIQRANDILKKHGVPIP